MEGYRLILKQEKPIIGNPLIYSDGTTDIVTSWANYQKEEVTISAQIFTKVKTNET